MVVGAAYQLQQTPATTGIFIAAGEDCSDVLCKKFFRDPSKSWWDDRNSKQSPRQQPDFKHRLTHEPLWMDSRYIPPWVTDELMSRRFPADHQCSGVVSNSSTAEPIFPSDIWACCKRKDLSTGTRIHNLIKNSGLLEKYYSDALITMYATCGELRKAEALLDVHNSSSVVAWTALITGYVQQGQGQIALNCFDCMRLEGILPNAVTYVCLLKACAAIGSIDKGKKFHDEISRQGLLEHDVVLGGALVDMYAKCGALRQARDVLEKLPSRNVVSWSALIAGYVQKGQGQQALKCFEEMQHEGIPPNPVTYSCILKACATIGAIEKGKGIHKEILRQGFLKYDIVLGNALVDMYAKCGALPQAQSVLEKLPSRNVVSWSALIAGYTENGQGQEALKCFRKLQKEGICPDAVTYTSILKACAVLGAIEIGKQIHNEILRQGFLEQSVVLGSALVDMYAKCGALSQAQHVFQKLPSRDIFTWNAMIAGNVQEGQGEQALKIFAQMQHEGVLPDIVTFHSLLNLCSHLGMVEKGQELFYMMGSEFGLELDLECFICMIDLFGRAGQVVKAVTVIQEMPFPANSTVWTCLLGACRKWVDVKVGAWVFEQALGLDKCDEAAYVLLVNTYTAADMPKKAKDVEAMRVKNQAWKLPECNPWIDPNNTVLDFCVDHTKHP